MLHFKSPRCHKESGFSIVELMVAILIGLIILAGVIQVVVSSKTTFLGQEDMSYIQENARYAVRTMTSDIQNAGFWGCAGANPTTALVANVENATDALAMFGLQAINSIDRSTVGLFSDDPLWTPPASSGEHKPDFFFVRRAGGETRSVVSHAGTSISLDSSLADDISEDDYLAIVSEDCQKMGVIQLGAVNGANISYAGKTCTTRIRPAKIGQGYTCADTTNATSDGAYLTGSTAMEYISRAYFVGTSSVLPNQPALKRKTLRDGTVEVEEIALGIEDMQVLYGLVSVNGENVQFLEQPDIGAADWERVVAVKLNLVFRSQSQSLTGPLPNPLPTFLGNQYDDRYIRQLISKTVFIRNRT